VPAGWDDWKGVLDPGTYSMYQYRVNANGAIFDVAALTRLYGELRRFYQTDVLTYFAADFVARAPQYSSPFFLYVNPLAPHIEMFPPHNECRVAGDTSRWGGNFYGVAVRPAQRHMNTIFGDEVNFPLPRPPSFNEADVSDKPDWVQENPLLTAEDVGCLKKHYWRRLESMLAVDEMVGLIFRVLEYNGDLDNTVVVFTSDNGFLLGEHRQTQKLVAYEEAVRVPLIIRTPENETPREISRIVLNNDLAPTIAALAGATPTHAVDGLSLLPLIQNPDIAPWRTTFLIEHWNDLAEFGGVNLPPDYVAMRSSYPIPQILVKYPTVTTGVTGELYDLAQDPYEVQSLFQDPARQGQIAYMSLWLNALKTCRSATCLWLEHVFTF
jgi:arylsulfatase A-like enzyme